MEGDDVLVGLARSYLFEGLTGDQLRPLAAASRARSLTRGEALIRVGDPAEEIYVVVSGELRDSVVDADGSVVVHFLHGPGMTFGEPGYFALDRHRIVEVIATEPTVVVRLARRELAPFMAQHPSTKDRVLEKLAACAGVARTHRVPRHRRRYDAHITCACAGPPSVQSGHSYLALARGARPGVRSEPCRRSFERISESEKRCLALSGL